MAGPYSINPALDAANFKLGRANQHLRTLADEMTALVERNPYGVTVEFGAGSRWWVAKARISEEPSPLLSVLVGEVAYECLSGVNHLVWELASREVGRRKVFDRLVKGNVQFPVARLTPGPSATTA
jgi:hypothetical protein